MASSAALGRRRPKPPTRSSGQSFSGTQAVLAQSFLKPGAFLRSSFVSSSVSHHLSFLADESGMMTSFSPTPEMRRRRPQDR